AEPIAPRRPSPGPSPTQSARDPWSGPRRQQRPRAPSSCRHSPRASHATLVPVSLVAFYSDPLFLQHHTGTGHVDRPARLAAVAEAATRRHVSPHLLSLSCPDASIGDVAVVHDRDYLRAVA